jgi:hypothetical protein
VSAAQPDDIRRSVRRIIAAGDSLPAQLRAEIVGLGADAIPVLVEILSSEELALSASLGAGSAAVHAADLLGALRAVTAVEAMIRALVDTQPGDVLFDALVHALTSIGEPIVGPVLRVYAETEDATARVGLTSALAGAGVLDDRILVVLVEQLMADPTSGAIDLATYGDPRALPALHRCFDSQPVDGESPAAHRALVDIREAIELLGGELTPAQRQTFDRAMASAERRQHATRPGPARKREVPGRNDPCWCGSNVKYKKCHLRADEGAATPGE